MHIRSWNCICTFLGCISEKCRLVDAVPANTKHRFRVTLGFFSVTVEQFPISFVVIIILLE